MGAGQDAFHAGILRRRAVAARPDYFDITARLAAPKPIDPAWRSARLVPLRTWRARAESRTVAQPPALADAPLQRFRLRDAEVLKHGGFLEPDEAVDEFMFAGQPGWRDLGIAPVLAQVMPVEHFDVESERLYYSAPARTDIYDGPVFCFPSPYALANFGHFVHDLLTQLVFVDDAKRSHPDLRFIVPAFHVPGFRYRMQEFLFRELVGPLERVIFHRDGSARITTLLAGEPVFALAGAGRIISRPAIRAMIGRVRAHFAGLRSTGGPRRIYITRDDGVLARQVEGEPELRAMLTGHGFVPVTIARHAPQEIIALLSGAEAIVGVHGAGLMNMIFCDPDVVRIIELDTYPSSWNSIQAFAEGAGIAHARIPATRSTQEGTLGRVDMAALEAAISGLNPTLNVA